MRLGRERGRRDAAVTRYAEITEAVIAMPWPAVVEHRTQALDYAMGFARDLDRAKADRFVGMYVNDWTRDAGPKGKEAVRLFLSEAADLGLVPRVVPEFQER